MSVAPAFPRFLEQGGVTVLDTGHGAYPGTIASFLLDLPEGGFALIESGPGSSLETLLAAIEASAHDPADLRFLLVTHIHLDHAGAAGELLQRSGAELIVHRIGAPHLVDPSRLMASALRIYGDAMGELWGRMLPAPAGSVRAVDGGEALQLGGLSVRVLYTPGHASHHVSYLLDDGTLFTGDSAGVLLPGAGVIRPAVPPPEVALEAWEDSVARMRAANPSRLMLTHFGQVMNADAHLAALPERNRTWADSVLQGMNAGEDEAALVRRVQELEDAEMTAAGMLAGVKHRTKMTSDAAMTVMGLTRYWRKQHPERLTSGPAR